MKCKLCTHWVRNQGMMMQNGKYSAPGRPHGECYRGPLVKKRFEWESCDKGKDKSEVSVFTKAYQEQI